MLTLTATEFVNKFGQWNQNVQVEPIEVKSHGRTVGFYVSPKEYAKFEELKAGMTRIHDLKDMPDEFWDEIKTKRSEARASGRKDNQEYNILFPGDSGYPDVE